MGGREYTEGVILLSQSGLIGAKPANASFVLGGKYGSVTFLAGHIPNGGACKDEQVEIYADGVLIKTIAVEYGALPERYIIDVTGCNYLEFVLENVTGTRCRNCRACGLSGSDRRESVCADGVGRVSEILLLDRCFRIL